MENANALWHPVRWLIIFVAIIELYDLLVCCTVCSDNANNFNIPVARFCTGDVTAGRNPVVMDGFYADGLHDVTTCTCVAHSTKQVTTFRYENAYNVSPIQYMSDCGSSVTFSQSKQIEKPKSCQIDGSITINTTNGDLNMHLKKDTTNGNRSYCFKLYVDNGYTMTVSCVNVKNTTTTDSKESITPTTGGEPVRPITKETNMLTSTLKEDAVESTIGITDSTSKLSTASVQDNQRTNNPKASVTETIQNDDNNMLYIGVGSGIGGVILVTVVVLCIVKISRNRNKQAKPYENTDNNQTANEDSDEYGLQYNSLYISSDGNNMHNGENEHHTREMKNANIVHNEIEGNYSEIDLIEHHNRFNDNRSSSETNPEAPSRNENESSFISEGRELKHRSYVKHVSFGDNGCEYAVVEKTKRS